MGRSRTYFNLKDDLNFTVPYSGNSTVSGSAEVEEELPADLLDDYVKPTGTIHKADVGTSKGWGLSGGCRTMYSYGGRDVWE